jgi:hypothetical protein
MFSMIGAMRYYISIYTRNVTSLLNWLLKPH